MKYRTKCKICKELKNDVEWHFLGEIGCKDCADKYFKNLINQSRET